MAETTPWQGKKWNGQSVYQIDRRLSEAGNLAYARMLTNKALTEQIKTEELAAAVALVELLKRVKFEDSEDLKPENIRLGYGWDCPTSPTKHCAYNEAEDPMHDYCLFCGDPSERK